MNETPETAPADGDPPIDLVELVGQVPCYDDFAFVNGYSFGWDEEQLRISHVGLVREKRATFARSGRGLREAWVAMSRDQAELARGVEARGLCLRGQGEMLARGAAARTASEDVRRMGRGAFYFRLALASLLAAGAGAVILFIWALHISDPCPCTAGFCILGDPASSGADAHLDSGGAGLGVSLGGIGLLIVTGCLVSRFRTRLRHPFVTQVFGFAALYILVLATVWAVARGIWGPTKC